MIYPNSQGVAVMGHGLIANALRKRDLPPAVYFFSSPSSNVLFDEQLDYCMSETLNDLLNVLKYCRDTKTLLVLPSSATVYNKNTSYARCKAATEEIVQAYGIPYLGLRISAGYGPGEAHKGKYASVVYQWTKMMQRGERPVIFGDGTQTRDFIHEDDIAENIERLVKEGASGYVDIGSGINTSFNDLVAQINEVLELNIEPIYVPKPKNYVPETRVQAVPIKISLSNGIRTIAGY